MMHVADAHGLVHVTISSPAPNAVGDTVAGLTRCGRWWVWASMKVGYHYGDIVVEMGYVFTSPTCLACIDDRHPR